MKHPDPRYSPRRATAACALLVSAALLVVAFRAAAAGSPLMAVFLGPLETDGVVLREVVVRLDGREVPVRTPAAAEPLEGPVVEVPVGAGPHVLDVELRLDGHADLFTYLNDYRFVMRGRLDLPARAGEVSAVKVGVVRSAGLFLRWEDRHRLALSATSYRSDREGAEVPPVPDPLPVQDAPPVAAACALEPVGFGFDQAVLTPRARQALDRFAACLGASSRALRVEGHCDLRGGADYNQRLGQRRADAVVKYLRERGLTAIRFTSRSWGKSRPLCDLATEACHARNRRVEAALED